MNFERVTALPRPPHRPQDGHKGTFGRVVIVAGSRGMSGAAALSGLGALRGGAGLVFLAVPAGIVTTVAAIEPSYLTIPLPEDEAGHTALSAKAMINEAVSKSDAVAFGPGCGMSDGIRSIIEELYAHLDKPLVVDADGLNNLASRTELLATHSGPRILTPHPGEFARMTNQPIETADEDREIQAVQFAKAQDVVLVLKGHRTIVTDGNRLFRNATGNSGMATGGSGDVLTGLITSLLAQGMLPFEAAQFGVHLHGLAGDIAAVQLSPQGLIASDLPRFLCEAWKETTAQ